MPRGSRFWVPGGGMHGISRFVDRRYYIIDDDDRSAYLDAITRAQQRWDWTWLSYALMSSHVHHGFIAGNVEPERFYRSAHTRFAARYHRRPSRPTLGPVFAGRPKFWTVKPAHLLRMVAYHHRNPVTAGVVDRASESTWTSHRIYLRIAPEPPWFDVERALHTLGFPDTHSGRISFDECVMELDFDCRSFTDCEVVPEGANVASTQDIDWPQMLRLAAEIVGVSTQELATSRRPRAAQGRALVAYIGTNDCALPYRVIADKIGLSAGAACNLIKRKQSDPEFHRSLTELRRRLDQGRSLSFCSGQASAKAGKRQ